MAKNILQFCPDAKRVRQHTNRQSGDIVIKHLHTRHDSRRTLSRGESSREESNSDLESSLSYRASAEVIDIAAATVDEATGIKRARLELALSLVEAAAVLGISASTLEREEAKTNGSLEYNDVVRKYELHVASTDGKRKRQGNLIFGSLPLKVARHILDLSIEQMARRQGYSLSHWKKIETNFRPISDQKIGLIEEEVKAQFENLCNR